MSAGKGDRLRPIRDRERFSRNWDRIFGVGNKSPETQTESRECAINVTPDPDINPAVWEEKDE